jgi:hypothetical protein
MGMILEILHRKPRKKRVSRSTGEPVNETNRSAGQPVGRGMKPTGQPVNR